MEHAYIAIMAGGIGTRFWPQSRMNLPKQFLDILGTGSTLLQSTYRRFAQIVPENHIYIITGHEYSDLVRQQLPSISDAQIIAEPMRCNTAPCVAYMAYKLANIDPQATFVVAPADHLIENEAEFQETIGKALTFASEKDAIVTLGIKPTRPHTGYGYIQYDDEMVYENNARRVITFTEKPDYEIALQFINSGDFLWNSGIFIWQVGQIIKAFEKYAPDISGRFSAIVEHYNTPEEAAHIAEAYSLSPSISIDYAIMERAENVFVIPSSFGWSDLGTWLSLWEKCEKDYFENVALGKNILFYDSANCLVSAPEDKLVVVQGLEDFCIIDTPDVLLIGKIENEKRMRDIHADVQKYRGSKYL
jgi:mannose-1-phosphate guanylyltransferase